MMNHFTNQVQEIEKHKWIESEKVGHDVGEDWAAVDWVSRFAEEYRQSIGREERCQVRVSVRISL